MISKASSDFWSCFDALPKGIQRAARKQYRLFRTNPSHPSLRFKEIGPGLVSVRISAGYRALGCQRDDTILWFWIGKHADYDRLIK